MEEKAEVCLAQRAVDEQCAVSLSHFTLLPRMQQRRKIKSVTLVLIFTLVFVSIRRVLRLWTSTPVRCETGWHALQMVRSNMNFWFGKFGWVVRSTPPTSVMPGNCSFKEVDHLMTYLELVIYVPIFVCGLILNAAALLVFCVFLRKWTESIIYMSSLALMDLLLLFLLPFKMHATSNPWPAHLQPLCSILESLYFVGIYGSIYTILSIAVDRWLAICHPFKAKLLRSPRAALVACVGVWLVVLAVIFPTSYRFKELGEEELHCFHRLSEKVWSPLVIICLLVFGFLAPALVLVYCSVQVIWALQQSGQNSPQSRACVKIIYSGLSAFLLPFTPSHLAILLQFLVRSTLNKLKSSRRQTSAVAACFQVTVYEFENENDKAVTWIKESF